MEEWYCLYCHRGETLRAASNLIAQNVTCYSPRIHVGNHNAKQDKELFPSYLFIKFDYQVVPWRAINNTRGVSHFIRNGKTPTKVSEQLINEIKDIEERYRLNPPACLTLQVGQRLRIKDGCFQGLEAIYLEPDKNKRAIVLLNILNNTTKLSVANRDIDKI